MPGINIGAHVMPQQKKLSLRDIFHNLGNKHYVALLGAGVTNERLEDILNREGLPLDEIKVDAAAIESKMQEAPQNQIKF